MNNYLLTYLKNRPLFLSIIRSQEAKLFQDCLPLKKPILDFGCGDGFFAKVFYGALGKIDVGIDVDKKKLEKAKAEKIYKKVIYYDRGKLPFPNKYFSTVISNCVLEHIDNLEGNLSEIHRVLKPNGRFFCTAMTDKWEDYLFGNILLGSIYKKWMRKKQIHKHLLSKKNWDLEFKKAGFKTDSVVGYMDKNASRWMDFLHYISFPSLIFFILFGKWVLFPQIYDMVPFEKLLGKFSGQKVSVNETAAIFFRLTKI